ncbi:protein translocase SEC61 complex subunit gamma [Candidatus Woesearchaeota archaeon]|nr:protein translocase SEC61 complex subunit gamma [Candidatus Woesearchaeota archaeon]
MGIAEWPGKASAYVKECGRVLKVTKKPTMTEFQTIVKVSAAGMLLIGAVGFLIQMVKVLLL